MRVIIQKVKRASVTVNNQIISSIGPGLLILVGLTHSDSELEIDKMVSKIVSLRLFQEEEKHWKKSVKANDFEILSVSQFTLYAKTSKGSKPDFHLAMKADFSKPLYELFLRKLEALHPKVKDGEFGAMMDVELVNDGPVTIILDSEN
ncbi:D-tyrosyl-tRNA(Tyr) deacylase [Boothiomyces macroporosus]|uniref:D-aminoacyl-tRNA deacylase n=1 Tax=Boothiomyces macroporosus TaxID=261099 RepID=A0AAD5UJS8_9FUNG|nr:D-tyrosyl-tRNA(Tyr) deacylase [Boothiomyces macroporosus]